MLCLPILNPVSGAIRDASLLINHKQENLSAAATPSSLSYNNTSLYSIPLPPQPHISQTLDTFSTPSSSTPCSLPAVRSWQQVNGAASTGCGVQNTTTPKQPLILDSLTASKVSMVENLVDTAALIIESIWPSPSGAQYSTKAPVIPLHIFVKETLRRSRTTLSTLQLALYYIYKVRNQVLAAQEKIRQDQIQHLQQRALQQGQPLSPNGSIDALSEEEYKQRDYFNSISMQAHSHLAKNTPPLTPPGTNNTPASLSPLSLSSSTPTSPILAKSEPVGCGRRMFLAALILASKFQQDRTYSNKAWSKISGLPVSEINLNEITFLTLIDYRLFVSQAVFQKWVTILTEKGRVRDRTVNRSYSMHSSDSQSTRRNSIQYCNNTLPSRMTCVTASSLEQHQPVSCPPQALAPHLPSFALFVGEQHKLKQSTTADQGSSFQFDFTAAGAPSLPNVDDNTVSKVSGLFQPEALPRQQQGMGAYLTHRWVQAQQREFLKSRMQAMGYTVSESPRSSPLVPQAQPQPSFEQQQQNQYLHNFQNNIITYSSARTYSLKRPKRSETKQHDFMPSPASSASPKALAGSKRRANETDALDATSSDEMRSRNRRRLSVSFLVDC
ncbi:hypothetical protein BGZ80_011455 [Entomortierella chlamydospora]|uniref:G1 s-specific cyclin n=1 Tax=Entomortierella chlamydospora TaxID=101097 RepID=A0A9P6MUF6_9FUNG|nr:hypothetical protein BGZ79_003504 [Entomortierella chlamydospora]KAG0012873.1 hypothetical protein BGZ80_011455 [Entomortierella chlamydospora]